MKKSPIILSTLALALFTGITAADAKKTQIVFAFWGQPIVLKDYDIARKEFEKLHPDIQVKLIQNDYGAYFDKITTMFAAGTGPDVAWYECNQGPSMSWVTNGIFTPLDTYIKSDRLDVNTLFYPTTINAQRYDGKTFGKKGKIYGLPKGWNTDGLFYNRDLFDKAGLSYPTNSWTWNNLVEAGKKLTISQANSTVSQIGLGTEGDAWNFILQAGGNMTDDDGNLTVNSSAVISGLQFWADLSLKHKISPYTGMKGMPAGWADAWMMKNKAAMGICATWFATPFIKDKNPERFGVAALPNGKINNGILYIGGVGISKTSKNKKAAWEWVKYISTDKNANIQHGRSLDEWPPLMEACKSSEMVKPRDLKFDRSALITQLYSSTLRPAAPKYIKRVEDIWTPIFNEQVKLGKTTAAAAIPPMAARIKAVLSSK